MPSARLCLGRVSAASVVGSLVEALSAAGVEDASALVSPVSPVLCWEAISTSVGFGGSCSPNLTMGIDSSIALARPFALLCRGLPTTSRGPYRSGLRCARMAPVMMMIRKRAVMTPVILYKMIMATAVEGEGPNGFVLLPLEVSVPFELLLCPTVPAWAMLTRYMRLEELDCSELTMGCASPFSVNERMMAEFKADVSMMLHVSAERL